MSATDKFKQLDLRFEQFLDSVLLDFIETDFQPEKRDERRARADADDLEFCKIYFPHIFELPWNELHVRTANLAPGMYTRSGFRHCGKSAVTYITLLVKPIALDIGGLIGINCQTLEDLAKEKTASIKRLIMRNRLLLYDYDITLEQDLKGHYIFGSTHFVAGSMNKGLRAMTDDEFKRFKRIVNDDMYDRTNVTHENHCARVVDFVEYECSGQLEDDGICLTLGNATAENAPIITLANKNPRNHFSLPALDENGESTWPEYMPDAEAWEAYREKKSISYDVWQGDYLDKPGLKGDIFQPDWFREININTIEIIATVSACDPSHGQSPSACDKGLGTVSLLSNEDVVAEDIYLRKESYIQLFDYVDAIRSRFPLWKCLFFENDFSQFNLAEPWYQQWCKHRQKVLPISLHHTSQLATAEHGTDKDSRILNLVYPHQTGKFQYRQGVLNTPDGERYKAQLLSFGKSKTKLDGPDCMATAYIMVRRWKTKGNFKSIKKRTFDKLETWFR